MNEYEEIEFTVKCKMKRRWANQFMSMLNYFEAMGKLGHSCRVGFYADGDGDFRPEFETDFEYTETIPRYTAAVEKYCEEVAKQDGEYNIHCPYNEVTYDAG